MLTQGEKGILCGHVHPQIARTAFAVGFFRLYALESAS